MRRNLLVIGFVMVFALIAANIGMAQTTVPNDLIVTATVVPSCRITSVTDIGFGTYDPTDAADNDAGSGDINFRCVRGTDYNTYIVGTRTMTDGGVETLDFELYSDAGRTTTYPSATEGITGNAANNAIITSNIYGRIAALQDVAVGSYSVTLTATVEY
jgi:spore coat protein U-like protein